MPSSAGYSLFTLDSIFVAAYLIQDHNLKHKRFGPLFQPLPPLETLDRLMVRLIAAAFALFTCALVLDVVLAHRMTWDAGWVRDPKIAATIATWLVYGALLYLRVGARRHGRAMAWVARIGLAFVLFAAVGVRFMGETVHRFAAVRQLPGGPQ